MRASSLIAFARRRWALICLCSLFALHAAALACESNEDGATWDEVGHLAAGWSHLQFGTFSLYRVNPPLVRMVACLTTRGSIPLGKDFREYRFPPTPANREEFALGQRIIDELGVRYFALLAHARWACIPFSLLGALVCLRWAQKLYGLKAGAVACALWLLDPNILGYGHLITPDVGATSVGLAANYLFWRWTNERSWSYTAFTGFALGVAELTKSTWIVLALIWPAMLLLSSRRGSSRRTTAQFLLIGAIGLLILNLGYGFEGSFKRLGDFQFVSNTFAGAHPNSATGNRWRDTRIGSVRVPLPEFYVSGIDVQRSDFENKQWSYLCGQWRVGGWWYYYLFAFAIKTPLGTLLMISTAFIVSRSRGDRQRIAAEAVLLAPSIVILIFVSSQTGFNHHLRYILPAVPYLYIWASRLVADLPPPHRFVKAFVAICIAWNCMEALLTFPHSLSYFNELVGGPRNGHYYLGNSNSDWGQDLLYLQKWLLAHPERRPLFLAYDMPWIDPRILGIKYERAGDVMVQGGPPVRSGRYVISVNQLHTVSGRFRYFLTLKPIARVGYTMNVYEIP